MDEVYAMLVTRAKEKYGAIHPVNGNDFSSGMICDDGFVQFWFNTPDHSSHLEMVKLSEVAS